MAIIPKFNLKDIDDMLKNAEKQYQEQVIRVLRFVGEKAVNEAKSNGNYQDRTGNLRNSIGFIIAINGKIVDEDFNLTANGEQPSKDNPIRYGKRLAREVLKGQQGISLIVVAGMRYASYVESKGKVVLTSAEQFANATLPNLLRQLR